MSNRFKGVLAIMLMLLGCGGAAIVYGSTHDNHKTNSYQEELAAAPVETEPLVHINEDFSVDESFSSHLPIVIIDT